VVALRPLVVEATCRFLTAVGPSLRGLPYGKTNHLADMDRWPGELRAFDRDAVIALATDPDRSDQARVLSIALTVTIDQGNPAAVVRTEPSPCSEVAGRPVDDDRLGGGGGDGSGGDRPCRRNSATSSSLSKSQILTRRRAQDEQRQRADASNGRMSPLMMPSVTRSMTTRWSQQQAMPGGGHPGRRRMTVGSG
jgi:hypothetical protein